MGRDLSRERIFPVFSMLFCLLILQAGTGCDQRSHDLEPHWTGAPFQTALGSPPLWKFPQEYGFKRVLLAADVDGDGCRERVSFAGDRVLAGGFARGLITTITQKNLPRDFYPSDDGVVLHADNVRPFPSGYLTAAGDVLGTGCEQVFLTAVNRQGTSWRLFIMDFSGQERDRSFPLPVGRDLDGGNGWDGCWFSAGCLQAGQAGSHGAVVMVGTAGMDFDGRQVGAVDAITGEFLWRFSLATNPKLNQAWVGDLEEDGRQEIVLVTGAPGNGSVLINDTNGHVANLLVFSARGELVTKVDLGGLYTYTWLAVADLDGDGRREIIVATDNTNDAGSTDHLLVFDPEGSELARAQMASGTYGIAAHEADDGPGGVWVAERDGILRYYRLLDGELEETSRGHNPNGRHIQIIGSGNSLRSGEPEVLVLLGGDNRVVAADDHCRPLFLTEELQGEITGAMTFRSAEDEPMVAVGGAQQGVWRLESRGILARTPVIFVGGGMMVVGVAFWLLLIRMRKPGSQEPEDVRILLGELAQVGHGKINLIQQLERVPFLAAAGRTSSVGGEGRNETVSRLNELLIMLLEQEMPRLAMILDRTDSHESAREISARARTDASECTIFLTRLRDSLPAAVAHQDILRYRTYVASLQECLREIRFALQAMVLCAPENILKDVLEAYTDDFKRLGITVEKSPSPSSVICSMPAVDVRFVLENLIGNAVRAMQDSARRQLVVRTWQPAGYWELVVEDSGCGVEPADSAKIFREGFSTRQEGGLGLFRSRELLAHWDGSLELDWSQPGLGSRFIVCIRQNITVVPGSQSPPSLAVDA